MELTDPSQALHSLTSALAPTLAPTQDVFPGEELVSISGRNSTIGYVCGALTLHLSSGRVIECKGDNPCLDAPFTHHAAASPSGYHEPTFANGRCTGLRPIARPQPQPAPAGRPPHAAAATAATQSGRREENAEASSECCDEDLCCGICMYLLLIAGSIVMILTSESIKQGWYVTEALCRATNEWQCEFYQMATECKVAPIGAGLVDTNCTAVEHYIPTFSVGGGSISEEFSCSRYQIIEPAGVEQCKQMAANLYLTGSKKACYFDEDSDTCYAGVRPHDEATAGALLITGIVLLLICTLPCALGLLCGLCGILCGLHFLPM